MSATKFKTIDEYIESLDPVRKEIIQKIRQSLLKSLDENFEETISYNMIGFVVPFSMFPSGYHAKPSEPLPFINLASQKQSISLYCMCGYDPGFSAMVLNEFTKAKLKLDMGKGCIRIKEKDFLAHEHLLLNIIQKIGSYMTANEWMHFYKKTFVKKKD